MENVWAFTQSELQASICQLYSTLSIYKVSLLSLERDQKRLRRGIVVSEATTEEIKWKQHTT